MLSLPDRFNAAAHFIDPHTELRPGKIAIECGDERITYGELAAQVNRVGNALRREFGVRIEERVLLLLPDTPDFAACFFGAMKIGAVPVPVNTRLNPADYEYMLNDSRARVAIVSGTLLPQIAAIPRAHLAFLEHIIVSGKGDLIASQSPEMSAAPTRKDDPAFWLYSSGSTGRPKACVHLQHDMVVTCELYAKQILNITEQDRFFSVAKLFFAYGLGNGLYFSLGVGGTSILLPGQPTPATVFNVIERYRPTLLFSVPSNYAALLAHRRAEREFDVSSVRYAVSAGESLPASIFERFKARFGVEILDAIGSTEALHMFIANRPGAVRPGSSGQIIPGMEAKILDEDGRLLPMGEIGNLYVQSDAVCACYWNQHEKSKDTIDGHWLRTGDKYRQDADGYFWYAGRSDDMLKVSGRWVSPAEIENALVEHPAVLEAAVVARKDQDDLVKPAAYVVVANGHAPDDSLALQLQAFVAEKLAPYKRPRWIDFLPELPKTATGKIQRFKLRDRSNDKTNRNA